MISPRGIFTSEFWLCAIPIAAVTLLLMADKIMVEDVTSLWPLLTGPGMYAISRGMVKGGL